MTGAIQILLGLALLVAVILKVLDRDRPDPGEYEDVRSLQRSTAQRAALRRASRTR